MVANQIRVILYAANRYDFKGGDHGLRLTNINYQTSTGQQLAASLEPEDGKTVLAFLSLRYLSGK
ncbi:hypothetical protein O9993_23120 [Vibrio lentus]|nr:hypothetical protein [Vibrio lentus]